MITSEKSEILKLPLTLDTSPADLSQVRQISDIIAAGTSCEANGKIARGHLDVTVTHPTSPAILLRGSLPLCSTHGCLPHSAILFLLVVLLPPYPQVIIPPFRRTNSDPSTGTTDTLHLVPPLSDLPHPGPKQTHLSTLISSTRQISLQTKTRRQAQLQHRCPAVKPAPQTPYEPPATTLTVTRPAAARPIWKASSNIVGSAHL